MEPEKLPPTLGALIPHIQRANFIAGILKEYTTAINEIQPLVGNGWQMDEGMEVPIKCLELPAPQSVLELVKCGCKVRCKRRGSSSFLKNGLSWTELCKCVDWENIKDHAAGEETDADSGEGVEIH
eukprot:gene17484-9095_t